MLQQSSKTFPHMAESDHQRQGHAGGIEQFAPPPSGPPFLNEEQRRGARPSLVGGQQGRNPFSSPIDHHPRDVGPPAYAFPIPHSAFRLLIGTSGSTIHSIETQTHTRCYVTTFSGEPTLEIWSDARGMRRVMEKVDEIVSKVVRTWRSGREREERGVGWDPDEVGRMNGAIAGGGPGRGVWNASGSGNVVSRADRTGGRPVNSNTNGNGNGNGNGTNARGGHVKQTSGKGNGKRFRDPDPDRPPPRINGDTYLDSPTGFGLQELTHSSAPSIQSASRPFSNPIVDAFINLYRGMNASGREAILKTVATGIGAGHQYLLDALKPAGQNFVVAVASDMGEGSGGHDRSAELGGEGAEKDGVWPAEETEVTEEIEEAEDLKDASESTVPVTINGAKVLESTEAGHVQDSCSPTIPMDLDEDGEDDMFRMAPPPLISSAETSPPDLAWATPSVNPLSSITDESRAPGSLTSSVSEVPLNTPFSQMPFVHQPLSSSMIESTSTSSLLHHELFSKSSMVDEATNNPASKRPYSGGRPESDGIGPPAKRSRTGSPGVSVLTLFPVQESTAPVPRDTVEATPEVDDNLATKSHHAEAINQGSTRDSFIKNAAYTIRIPAFVYDMPLTVAAREVMELALAQRQV
ncbi:hypothetical protein P7C70_g3870, partial [Phenoliferia sp. Uapishka_3]